jgi:hypothetical protein
MSTREYPLISPPFIRSGGGGGVQRVGFSRSFHGDVLTSCHVMVGLCYLSKDSLHAVDVKVIGEA